MARSYAANDVIELPRMTAPAAHALGTALLAAGQKYGVPKSAKRAFDGLTTTHAALNDAMVLLASKKKYGPEVIEADRVIDNCWGGLKEWLGGWKRLPGAPQAARAAVVHDLLFSDGLGFIQLPYPEEWSESALRLQRLGGDDHEKAVADLGGKEFLTRLRAAHKAYGERLGITSATDATDPAAGTRRPQLDALGESLRKYVLKIAAHADEDDAGSEELVANLLKPLTEHRVNAASAAAEPTPPVVDTPTKPG